MLKAQGGGRFRGGYRIVGVRWVGLTGVERVGGFWFVSSCNPGGSGGASRVGCNPAQTSKNGADRARAHGRHGVGEPVLFLGDFKYVVIVFLLEMV